MHRINNFVNARKKQKTTHTASKSNLIIHNCIKSKISDLESDLHILAKYYPDSISSFDKHRFLLLHLAYIYHPQKASLIENLDHSCKSTIYYRSRSYTRFNSSKDE